MSSGTRIAALVLLAIAGLTLGGLTLLGFTYRLMNETQPAASAEVQEAGGEANGSGAADSGVAEGDDDQDS